MTFQSSDSPEILRVTLWPRFPSGNVAPIFYSLLCASFCDKNRNLAHSHRFLLQINEAADKTLEQCFLKEFKASCKNSDESELKQKKQSEKSFGLVILSSLQL